MEQARLLGQMLKKLFRLLRIALAYLLLELVYIMQLTIPSVKIKFGLYYSA
jgi:hypothetical protein